MTTPAKAQDAPRPVPIAAPFPGFVDPYSRTPIVGYTPGESQIRLANMRDEGTVTNYIHIYGLDEKKFLGAVQIDVPAKASVGVEPHLLLQTLAPVDWRQPIVLYVENGREKQLWQHVKQNPRTGAMEDASVCTTSPHIDYAPVRHVILNATIARVGYLTSGISVHNFSDVTGQFEARMTDAGTGESLGKVELVIEPRSTFTQTALWYFDNTDIRWFRAPDLSGSINIEFVPKSPDAGARLSVQHRVFDYTRDGSVNLSNPCAITGGTIAIPPLPAPQ